MFFFPILIALVFLAFVVQQFLPSLPNDARVYLLPLFVFYSAVAMPFWMMLVVAIASGLMWDAFGAQVLTTGAPGPDGQPALNVEIAVGWSILLYAAFGSIMSGFRPVFARGRWDIYVLASILSGVFTSMIVAAEFVMICFRRGGFFYTREIGLRVVGTGVAAIAIAPALFVFLNIIARVCGYEPHSERRVRR
jgi:hypothetical protein